MHFISTFKKYTQESKPVNPRIFVGVAAGVLVVILVVFTLTGTSVVSDVEGGFFSPSTQQQVLPLEIELFDLSILEVTEKQATLEIKFKVSNPNFKSVMLQHIKYSVYHNDARIAAGGLGTTPEGFLASPNYFIILNERPSIIGEKFTIMNTGNTPELWETLTKNELNWRVSGEAFFNLSSITAGQENILKFDFSENE
uniref:Water stress and hypersensitive response domain-containing protein n=2 Tax=environmental samples TaxID=651140 RepID=A0A075HDI8_9ARCH|nr:hypothetical protein [uncultured marine thaumarchaeote KM3_150_B03]AIF13959.1 hypothetical protein [uncultured marine thaumarchaeote KM3_65_D04]